MNSPVLNGVKVTLTFLAPFLIAILCIIGAGIAWVTAVDAIQHDHFVKAVVAGAIALLFVICAIKSSGTIAERIWGQ